MTYTNGTTERVDAILSDLADWPPAIQVPSDERASLLDEYDSAIATLDEALRKAAAERMVFEDALRRVEIAREHCHLARAALAALGSDQHQLRR